MEFVHTNSSQNLSKVKCWNIYKELIYETEDTDFFWCEKICRVLLSQCLQNLLQEKTSRVCGKILLILISVATMVSIEF